MVGGREGTNCGRRGVGDKEREEVEVEEERNKRKMDEDEEEGEEGGQVSFRMRR